MQVINSVGISILALLLFAVVQKKQKSIVDYTLMLFIGLFAALLWSHIWISIQLTPLSFVFQNLTHYFLFQAYALYALLLLDRSHQFQKEWWWIVSFPIVFTVFSVLDMTVFNEYDEAALRHLYEQGTLVYQVFYKAGFVFDAIVLYWVLQLIKQYQRSIKDYYSSIESIQLKWLYNFTMFLFVINVVILITFLLYNFDILQKIETVFGVTFALSTAVLFYFCYYGVRQYNLAEFQDMNLLQDNPRNKDHKNHPKTAKAKYQSSSLKEEEMNTIFQHIEQYFADHKAYLDPNLKVHHLAQQMGVTTHNISQTINSKADKPFYDLVNSYRVNHLKELLVDPDNQQFTILGLGMESGFNSKTSLNRIFKQHTGMSPGKFRLLRQEERHYQNSSD